MDNDVLKDIKDAEDKILKAKTDAQAAAKSMIAEAEKKGQAAVLDAVARAENEVKNRLNEADRKAAEKAAELGETTAGQQAEIRSLAQSRLSDASGMIVERIVNG